LNPLLTKKTFKKAIWRNKKCAQENEIKLGNSAQHVATKFKCTLLTYLRRMNVF
jgi:hypothetical protein